MAESIVLSEGGATLSAPETISCGSLPPFRLEGDAADLFGGDRALVNGLLRTMAQALTNACPNVSTLSVKGEDRGVAFSFRVTRESGWALPGDAPVVAAAAPAEGTAASVPAEDTAASVPAEAAPPASPPAEMRRAEIPPGLSFADFSRIFGPSPAVRGHVQLTSSEVWTRVLAARSYAEHPEMLEDDAAAIEIARQMMTPAEFQQFLAFAQAQNVNSLSVFQRRDLANRVRSQLRAGLDQRRQTGPIEVYHSVPIQLGDYDFATGAFPFDSRRARQYSPPQWQAFRLMGAINGVVLPSELRATEEQAKQLFTYLQTRQDRNLHLAVFLTIDPRAPRSLEGAGYQQAGLDNVAVKQVALFADPGLTQIIFDYTTLLAPEQAQVDAAAGALTAPLTSAEAVVRRIAETDGSEAVVDALAAAFATYGYNGQESPETVRARVRAAVAGTGPAGSARLGGSIRLSAYDPVRKAFPVQQIYLSGVPFEALPPVFEVSGQLVPAIVELPVAPEIAPLVQAAAEQSRQIEVRIEADFAYGAHNGAGNGYVEISATFTPRRVELFSGQQGAIAADRRLLARVELPEPDAAGSIFEGLRIDQ